MANELIFVGIIISLIIIITIVVLKYRKQLISLTNSYELKLEEDSLDLIEIKSSGARLSGKESRAKKLIEENKVGYRIIEGSIPKGLRLMNEGDHSCLQ